MKLEHKYKYRPILDESILFGTLGRTGGRLTELYNVPVASFALECVNPTCTAHTMLVGSVANGLDISGEPCAVQRAVVIHQGGERLLRDIMDKRSRSAYGSRVRAGSRAGVR